MMNSNVYKLNVLGGLPDEMGLLERTIFVLIVLVVRRINDVHSIRHLFVRLVYMQVTVNCENERREN